MDMSRWSPRFLKHSWLPRTVWSIPVSAKFCGKDQFLAVWMETILTEHSSCDDRVDLNIESETQWTNLRKKRQGGHCEMDWAITISSNRWPQGGWKWQWWLGIEPDREHWCAFCDVMKCYGRKSLESECLAHLDCPSQRACHLARTKDVCACAQTCFPHLFCNATHTHHVKIHIDTSFLSSFTQKQCVFADILIIFCMRNKSYTRS